MNYLGKFEHFWDVKCISSFSDWLLLQAAWTQTQIVQMCLCGISEKLTKGSRSSVCWDSAGESKHPQNEPENQGWCLTFATMLGTSWPRHWMPKPWRRPFLCSPFALKRFHLCLCAYLEPMWKACLMRVKQRIYSIVIYMSVESF